MARNKLLVPTMETLARHKILLLDDDQDLLDVYREILARLPSKPEIHTATSGARALALLNSHPFSLLLCDLRMPKMDGLQVLTIVRRKFPQLRTAVLTCILDEQFRARAYAMGIDLFLEKPNSSKEISFLLDCIESLLDREQAGGFRGVQSKSLVDLVQLECLSQSSSVLKVSQGGSEGKIWIHNGEVIDAKVDELSGVDAFRRILAWKTGSFELLPAEQGRNRAIFASYQGLLLETAQALDEKQGASLPPGLATTNGAITPAHSRLLEVSRFHGVEFALTVETNDRSHHDSWGLDAPDVMAAWSQSTVKGFSDLGETLQAGMLNRLEAHGSIQNLAVATRGDTTLCVGFYRSLPPETQRETMHKILCKWAS